MDAWVATLGVGVAALYVVSAHWVPVLDALRCLWAVIMRGLHLFMHDGHGASGRGGGHLTLVMFPALVYVYVRLARKEESLMDAEFGEAYAAYRRQVPGFIPRFSRSDAGQKL